MYYVKIKKGAFAAASMMAVMLLSCIYSCDDGEMDEWKISRLEASVAQNGVEQVNQTSFSLSPMGESVIISVKSISNWSLAIPDWLVADRMSGTGDARITLTAQRNEDIARQGVVEVATNGNDNGSGTIHYGNERFNFSQETVKGVISLRGLGGGTFTRVRTDRVDPETRFHYYDYVVSLSYEVSSSLSDVQLEQEIDEIYYEIKVDLGGRYSDSNILWPSTLDTTFVMRNLPKTNGEHTVTATFQQLNPSFLAHKSAETSLYCKYAGEEGDGKWKSMGWMVVQGTIQN